MDTIQRQLHIEQEQSNGLSWLSALRELFLVAANQKRLLFVISEQLVSQWSGANSITSASIPHYRTILVLTNSSICSWAIRPAWLDGPV